MICSIERDIAGRKLIIETGKMAKQASGAATVRYGDTMILAAAVMSPEPLVNPSFVPLTVDYREKQYAAGKFPGGFFKREGRPNEKEILTCRLIDRPIRPMIPEAWLHDTQVLLTVLSADTENDPDIPSMIGAFTALALSPVPIAETMAAVRIGCIDGEFILNPKIAQLEDSKLNMVVAGTAKTLLMVEGEAWEVSEEKMLEGLVFAQRALTEITGLIDELVRQAGKPKREVTPMPSDPQLQSQIASLAQRRLQEAFTIADKEDRSARIDELGLELETELLVDENDNEERAVLLKSYYKHLQKDLMRGQILEKGIRVDGRNCTEIREITCEVGLIPRAHGSALFTRGQTQALAVTTLGTVSDEQLIDGLGEEYYKKYMLHYNFPPFSTGEIKPLRGPGRREIGHGALAERALRPVLPTHEDFPYTIRVVSEILESNGSSSMASVCGGSLSLMDAGVPVTKPVAGIAMGLIKNEAQVAVLSDILGIEDHLGDMDFKVTGTRDGITAMQMDIKTTGISQEIMAHALGQAKAGRLHILNIMDTVLSTPRAELRPHAPRIEVVEIDIDKIREVIGPGGKVIRNIIAETGAKIDIEDDGRVTIASSDMEGLRKAKEMIEFLTCEVELGQIYTGKVMRTASLGAFVEILPGKEGLVRISELAERHINTTEDAVKVGDTVSVKVIEIDSKGRINLSKRQADRELRGEKPEEDDGHGRRDSGDRGGRDRGRDRDHRGGGGGERRDRGGRR